MKNYRFGLKILFMIVFSLVGCAGLKAQYGKFDPNPQATRQFETGQIREGYNYYITGSYQYPAAILGLDKNYLLDDHLWQKVEMTPKLLQEFAAAMQTRASHTGRFQPFGFNLLDERGVQIGVWYSLRSALTSLRVSGNRVTVISPPLDTYEKYEREKKH